jgi:very-short-patch-repair endonuclease
MPLKKHSNPPFESPLEEKFYNTITPLLLNNTKLIPQYEIETICKKFRLDFFIDCNNYKIGFELDGPTTHDQNSKIYDYWRDTIILYEGHVDEIYRFSGTDLMENMGKAILLLTDHIPKCIKLEKINKRNFSDSNAGENADFQLMIEEKEDAGRKKIYNYLLNEKGGRLNPLIYKYKKQYGDYGFKS